MRRPARPERGVRGSRLLRWCGAAAGPLFVGVFAVEGARRPGYDPARHPVSSLALGSRGWVQTANFAATGALYLAGAAGRSRATRPGGRDLLGAAALGAAGLGLLGAAAFPTDPVAGYPPGTPATPAEPTRVGRLHDLAALPVFLGIPAAALAEAWRSRGAGGRVWRACSAATGISMLAGTGLFAAGFAQASPRLAGRAGLVQRATIATGFAWLTAVALRSER